MKCAVCGKEKEPGHPLCYRCYDAGIDTNWKPTILRKLAKYIEQGGQTE